MLDMIKATVGEQNLQAAFWTMLGTMIISNVGLIVGAVVKHFRSLQKMRTDIKAAHDKIRIIQKELNIEEKKS